MTDVVTEKCCSGPCSYRVEAVAHHLDVLRAFASAGEQPGQLWPGRALDARFGGSPGDGPTALLDVGRVVEQLRAAGEPISAEAVAARLCPWSTSDAE